MRADIDGVQTLRECAEFSGNIVEVFPGLGDFLCTATPIPSGCCGCTTAKHPGAKNRSCDNFSDGWLHVLDAIPRGAGRGGFADGLAMLLAVLHQHCRAECCHS